MEPTQPLDRDPGARNRLPPRRGSRRGLAVLLAVSFASGAGMATVLWAADWSPLPAAEALRGPGERTYALEIRAADLPVGPGAVWHAWTFNGTVPGPMLTVVAGETLKVRVINHHTFTHSFHTHLAPYAFEHDGSQLNTITGVGASSMIAPGAEHTYVFHPTRPGVYYYHCHSADGDKMISEHIAQGLYGAIVVKAPDEPPVRDEAVVMAEIGFDTEGEGRPFYLMNGKGIPGGEHALEKVFQEQGLDGVKALLGTTVPILSGVVGEPMRIALVNVGDHVHSFHLHGMNLVSVDLMPGRIHPANVVQLLPGAAERILVTPAEAGLWLFHCHVVSHADLGMIGVLIVEESPSP